MKRCLSLPREAMKRRKAMSKQRKKQRKREAKKSKSFIKQFCYHQRDRPCTHNRVGLKFPTAKFYHNYLIGILALFKKGSARHIKVKIYYMITRTPIFGIYIPIWISLAGVAEDDSIHPSETELAFTVHQA
ncbi:hypothetical protein CFP56_028384 [Quercus suber]|uniref:Uncharacterized protein n=1 Tax=Quercus suber TaxID=58331 RepID=A0AAW0JU38_QUESU